MSASECFLIIPYSTNIPGVVEGHEPHPDSVESNGHKKAGYHSPSGSGHFHIMP